MRLCIESGCWVTEMIYGSRMDSQRGERRRSRRWAAVAGTHAGSLAINSPELSAEHRLRVWKQSDCRSALIGELRAVLAGLMVTLEFSAGLKLLQATQARLFCLFCDRDLIVCPTLICFSCRPSFFWSLFTLRFAFRLFTLSQFGIIWGMNSFVRKKKLSFALSFYWMSSSTALYLL